MEIFREKIKGIRDSHKPESITFIVSSSGTRIQISHKKVPVLKQVSGEVEAALKTLLERQKIHGLAIRGHPYRGIIPAYEILVSGDSGATLRLKSSLKEAVSQLLQEKLGVTLKEK